MYSEVTTTCNKCQSHRSANLKEACQSCGARKTIFGYLYEHEYRNYIWGGAIITAVLILACIAGVAFLATQSFLLN